MSQVNLYRAGLVQGTSLVGPQTWSIEHGSVRVPCQCLAEPKHEPDLKALKLVFFKMQKKVVGKEAHPIWTIEVNPESGPLRAVHLTRHKWPGGSVN